MISIRDDSGVERFMGNIEPPQGLVKSWPIYGSTPETNLIPRSEWPKLVAQLPEGPNHPFLPYVHNQGQVGQCNCDATTALAEFTRAMQGLPFVKLSAADLYARINGGADNGSLLEDAMHEMLTRGVGTADTAGLIWKRGQKLSPDSERARFKALEVFIAPTFDHFFSGLLEGCAGVSGIMWYPNYNPDAEGVLPRGRGSPGGHAFLSYKANILRTGEPSCWSQNSWTPQYGLQGRFQAPESAYGKQIGGLWMLRSITDEGGVIPVAA